MPHQIEDVRKYEIRPKLQQEFKWHINATSTSNKNQTGDTSHVTSNRSQYKIRLVNSTVYCNTIKYARACSEIVLA